MRERLATCWRHRAKPVKAPKQFGVDDLILSSQVSWPHAAWSIPRLGLLVSSVLSKCEQVRENIKLQGSPKPHICLDAGNLRYTSVEKTPRQVYNVLSQDTVRVAHIVDDTGFRRFISG